MFFYYENKNFSCNSSIISWGLGKEGQLGINFEKKESFPCKIEMNYDMIEISSGHFHNGALTKNGY